MKTLISWLAFKNDFIEIEEKRIVDVTGPTYTFHQYFFEQYDRHIILSSQSTEDIRIKMLENKLQTDFPDHKIMIDAIQISDVIDMVEIKRKVEAYLLALDDEKIDIYISPGTSAMQIAWFIIHITAGLNTRLLQTRPGKFTKDKKPELIEIQAEKSPVPLTAILTEKIADKSSMRENFKITPSIEPVYQRARKIAETDSVTTLILGETGTGKEHLARFIHDNSARKNKPFITVNCSAMDDSLLESRLFGFKKGAFTGALQDTPGYFKQADGGTIFLDEIGDISPQMQQSLLRVLQEKEIHPIGGLPKKINVRIIAATHKDLPSLCSENKFRWDLYYRLSVAELQLPSLLERGPKELSEMVEFFLKKEKKELKKREILKFTPEAKKQIMLYEFPGNLRELENLIRRLYVFNEGLVDVDQLPKQLFRNPHSKSLNWKDVEKEHIIYVLNLKRNNIRQTSMALGFSINTLKRKLAEYNIEV